MLTYNLHKEQMEFYSILSILQLNSYLDKLWVSIINPQNPKLILKSSCLLIIQCRTQTDSKACLKGCEANLECNEILWTEISKFLKILLTKSNPIHLTTSQLSTFLLKETMRIQSENSQLWVLNLEIDQIQMGDTDKAVRWWSCS